VVIPPEVGLGWGTVGDSVTNSRLRRLALGAASAALAVFAATGAAGADSGVHAAKACNPPTYPGSGYFTSLDVKKVSCKTGRKLALAYYRCRTKKSVSGVCHRKVMHYRCHETRQSIPTEIDARVKCTRGKRVVVHTYQQNR
jgi:hypothetical protein